MHMRYINNPNNLIFGILYLLLTTHREPKHCICYNILINKIFTCVPVSF